MLEVLSGVGLSIICVGCVSRCVGDRACVGCVWCCKGIVATVSCSGEVSTCSPGTELGATESAGPLGSHDGVEGRGGSMVAMNPQLTIKCYIKRRDWQKEVREGDVGGGAGEI